MIKDEHVLTLLGNIISCQGSARVVYAHIHDARLVIKEGREAPYVQNWTEWLIYTSLDSAPYQRNVLGEVLDISISGRFLIMERLDDLKTAEQRSRRRYPAWHVDTKTDAFGVNIAGEVRVRDFGNLSLGNILANADIITMRDEEEIGQWVRLLDS